MARTYRRTTWRARTADGRPIPYARATVWDAACDGTQVTDLHQLDGRPLHEGIVECDAWGTPIVEGFVDPADTPHLYMSASPTGVVPGVSRVHLIPADVSVRLARLEAEHAHSARWQDVRAHGAVGDAVTDDAPAFQAALDAALGGTVYIPDGSYRLGAPLTIASHTRILAEPGAVMLRHHTGAMLANYRPQDFHDGYDGNGYLRVEGGTWDARAHIQGGRANTWSLSHARHIRIRDVTIRNTCWAHAIELSAVRDVRISGCVFEGFTIDGDGPRVISEAVQIDGAYGAGYLNAPYFDGTPCHDVLVYGSTMGASDELGPFGALVGSHGGVEGSHHTGVRVADCHVQESLRYKVQVFHWKDWAVTGLTGPPAPDGDVHLNPRADIGAPSALDQVPRARVRARSPQAISTGRFTSLVFDEARYNVHGLWDPSLPDRFIAPIAGLYQVGASVELEPHSSGGRYLQLVHDDGAALVAHGRMAVEGSSFAARVTSTTEVELAAGDQVYPRLYQDSGVDLDLLSGQGATEAWARWVGPPAP